MQIKKSHFLIQSKKYISIRLNKKIISVKTGKSISNRRKFHIHIISKKPFTTDGLKFFLENYIPAGYEFIFTGCSDKCKRQTSVLQCNDCNISSALKDLGFYTRNLPAGLQTEGLQAGDKICPDILLIDDYGFFDYTHTTESTKNEYDTFFKSLFQFIYKTSGENNIKTILLTGNNNALYLKHHLNWGVRGMVHITSAKENFLTAIEVVSNGGFYIDACINILISEHQKYLDNKPISKLTDRQLEVLLEISNSLKNHQIAPKLNITVNAVEKHKSNIQEILNLPSDELTEYAVKNKNDIQFLLEFSKKRIWK